MTKKELRSIYKERRLSLELGQIERMQEKLLGHFRQLNLPVLKYVHSYLAINRHKEIDTRPILEFLKFHNPEMKIVIPKSDFARNSFVNYLYGTDTVLEKNQFGILEPADGEIVASTMIDLVLVPLLAFDKRGYRVGYGKGFYDQFLRGCRKDVCKVGLSFFEAIDRIDDTDDFDISLTFCVTPHRVYDF
jgi:5-formyltetrahydrofolate cyclo-ligase